MTTSTSDPLVAALYGAMAHASLAAGVVASVDLVADQAGPWTLTDEDRAATAAALAARLQHPAGSAQPEPGSVVAAVRGVQQRLAAVWAANQELWPPHLRHEVEELEARMARFVQHRTDADLVPVLSQAGAAFVEGYVDAPAAGDSAEVPSRDEVAGYSTADWMLLLQRLGVPIQDAKQAVSARAEAAGHTAMRSMRDLEARPDLVGHLLDYLHDPARTEGIAS